MHSIWLGLAIGLGAAIAYGALSLLFGWLGDLWRYLDREGPEPPRPPEWWKP